MSRDLDEIVKTLVKDTLQYTREDADLARQAAEKLATLDWQQVIMSHRQRELDLKMGVMKRFIEWLEKGGRFCDECPEARYEWGYRHGDQHTKTYAWPHSITPFRSDASDAHGKRYCWDCFHKMQRDVRIQLLTKHLEKHPGTFYEWGDQMGRCTNCDRLVPQKSQYSIPHRGGGGYDIYCVHCIATPAERQFVFCQICNKKTASSIYGYCQDCYSSPYHSQVSIHLERAKKAGTPATLTIPQWIATLEYFNEKCAYCQSRPAQALEHFIPIILGGGTTAENCVPSCKRCNSRKGDKPVEQLTKTFSRHTIERIINYLQSENKQVRPLSCRALMVI